MFRNNPSISRIIKKKFKNRGRMTKAEQIIKMEVREKLRLKQEDLYQIIQKSWRRITFQNRNSNLYTTIKDHLFRST